MSDEVFFNYLSTRLNLFAVIGVKIYVHTMFAEGGGLYQKAV